MTTKQTELQAAEAKLRQIVRELQSALVAFSGGVDSTLLARLAHEELGDRCLAVTVTSELYPEFQVEQACQIARQVGIRHELVETDELAVPGFSHNPPDRCYHCKKELFGHLADMAGRLGLKHVADGCNADDVHDHRPGMRAAVELGVRSPLKEAGLTKAMVRALSKQLGLPTWDRPSFACLASRFPYGQEITRQRLDQVRQAEEFLRQSGFRQYRVRHHDTVARIEVEPADLPRLMDENLREKVVKRLKELGFHYVTVDLEGFRSGSMNEPLKGKE